MSDKSEFYTEDGTWSCVTDHVTEPCGDCAGCDLVRSHNRALSRDPQWRRNISEAQLNAIEELCATASPVLTHPWKRDDAVAERYWDRQEEVVAEALAETCRNPKGVNGHCEAFRHEFEARRLIASLKRQGYEIITGRNREEPE